LQDDYGWADSGWHRLGDNDPAADVMTPNMNALVKLGIEMDRQYVYKYCSPTRSAIQSGRNPYHVNPLNAVSFCFQCPGAGLFLFTNKDLELVAGWQLRSFVATVAIPP
jgi:arylsulfatase A-like enzyme